MAEFTMDVTKLNFNHKILFIRLLKQVSKNDKIKISCLQNLNRNSHINLKV